MSVKSYRSAAPLGHSSTVMNSDKVMKLEYTYHMFLDPIGTEIMG